MSTPTSFAYQICRLTQQSKTNSFDNYFLEYDIQSYSNEEILAKLEADIIGVLRQHENVTKVRFIGHSFGGVYALKLAQQLQLSLPEDTEILTISSPFGGSVIGSMLSFVQGYSYFASNVSAGSPLITSLAACEELPFYVAAIVTTSGIEHPLLPENDLVVTVASQRALANLEAIDYTNLRYNHFEILLSDELVEIIVAFIH